MKRYVVTVAAAVVSCGVALLVGCETKLAKVEEKIAIAEKKLSGATERTAAAASEGISRVVAEVAPEPEPAPDDHLPDLADESDVEIGDGEEINPALRGQLDEGMAWAADRHERSRVGKRRVASASKSRVKKAGKHVVAKKANGRKSRAKATARKGHKGGKKVAKAAPRKGGNRRNQKVT